MSENKMDNRGSKSTISPLRGLVSTIFLVSVSLLVFALSPFIPFILSLPVLHFKVLLFSNSSLLAIFPLQSRAYGFNRRNFSSTNSSAVAVPDPTPFGGQGPGAQPVKIYKNADLDKVRILQENRGKCGVYR